MVAKSMFALLSFCLLTCIAAQNAVSVDEIVMRQKNDEKIKGMAFGTGLDTAGIRQPSAEESMRKMKADGVNYVHVSAYANMRDKLDLSHYKITTDDDIRFQIQMAKRNGLKVFFKPVFLPDNAVWRGFIPGRDEWLRGDYKNVIVRMAQLAETEGVDLFAVGSEYADTLSNEAAWRFIISEVRKVFSNELTYVGNHDTYQKCKFWDALDVIGISAYFILIKDNQTFGRSPDLRETIALWEKEARILDEWRVRTGLSDKQVLIAEVGAESKGGGVVYRKPFDWLANAQMDENEQAKMYEGILTAFITKPWCTGVIFWHWELNPNPWPWMTYTPQGKMAEGVMKKHFTGN